MNKWNRLLKCLDSVFGFENQVKSTFKKIKQGFDANANEHVIIIEYRVMRGDNLKVTKKKRKEQRGLQRAKKIKVGNLLRDINAQVVTGDESPQVDSLETGELP